VYIASTFIEIFWSLTGSLGQVSWDVVGITMLFCDCTETLRVKAKKAFFTAGIVLCFYIIYTLIIRIYYVPQS